MVQKGRRADYTCEILDDGQKPLFKVTCSDDPHNPIVRDSASGAWFHIVNKHVSGPFQFGLTEPSVLKLIQDLPNADKCINFRHTLV